MFLDETYHPNVALRVVLYKSEAEHIHRLNGEVAFGKSARRYKRVPRFPERIIPRASAEDKCFARADVQEPFRCCWTVARK